ncbi:hypothetical protein DFH09DRAFT_1108575 [Mycena vulgaris]|nr:hypothetical protein DFH09DRAFT_1108575 [Mycena vulgaris]
MVWPKGPVYIDYRARLNFRPRDFLGCSAATLGSGSTYYDEELKWLFCLLTSLPETIPTGDAHNFAGYLLVLRRSIGAPTSVPTADVEELRVSLTPETEDRLSVLNTDDTDDTEGSDDDPPNHFLQPMTLRAQCDGVNITLPFFRDLLSGILVQGANTIRGLPDWSGTGETNTEAAREAPGKAVWDGRPKTRCFRHFGLGGIYTCL